MSASGLRVPKKVYSIDENTRSTIATRCNTLTKAINREFWNGSNDLSHSFYVGSYGRHTAIDTSDVDILLKLPQGEYERYDYAKGNGQSRLLQAVKEAVQRTYSTSDIHADGQVVVIKFSDGIKFELLPAFENSDFWRGTIATYTYPDTNTGGKWKSTNPKAEIKAMTDKDGASNGLFFDTCKHLRYVRDNYRFGHISGILIDTFVYNSIGSWRWASQGHSGAEAGSFEQALLDSYNRVTCYGLYVPTFLVPGSFMRIEPKEEEIANLGKVLERLVG